MNSFFSFLGSHYFCPFCPSVSWVKSNPPCSGQQFPLETEIADYLSDINLTHITDYIAPFTVFLVHPAFLSENTEITLEPQYPVKSLSSNAGSLDFKFIILSGSSVSTFIWMTFGQTSYYTGLIAAGESNIKFAFKTIDSNRHPFANKIFTSVLGKAQWLIYICIIQMV